MQTCIIARTLVFNGDDKLLLLRRCADDRYRPGGIDLPGGSVEPDEHYIEGALRETLEEAGLNIDRGTMRLVYAYARPNTDYDGSGDSLNAVGLFFACRTNGSDVILNPEEHDEAYWCTLDEAVEKTDHPHHKEMLSYIRDNNITAELWG